MFKSLVSIFSNNKKQDYSLESIEEDFDRKIVSGYQLLDCLTLYSNILAIIVRTNLQLEQTAGNIEVNYGVQIQKISDEKDSLVLLKHNTERTYLQGSVDVNQPHNGNFELISQVGCEYNIELTARYASELIKDDTSKIIGICFTLQ